ncbi:MAG: hypothetical protein NC213_07145 [Acetobacter sp.]|nr:hypothetical protein [Bacteroides sp.]MCM1341504.1 hypothetical protein [Acetobacter sp.]MCM1433708.1 hypothetical protein [Clostridiales bacterium]
MKNFFTKLGYKIQKFMTGRYGADHLFKALMIMYLVLMVLAAIVGRFSRIAYYSLYTASLILFIFSIYRVLSKNISVRAKENSDYLKFIGKIKKSFALTKDKFAQRKTHKFVKCKQCKKTLRLPRHKGKIKVTCPHCTNEFIINTGKKN